MSLERKETLKPSASTRAVCCFYTHVRGSPRRGNRKKGRFACEETDAQRDASPSVRQSDVGAGREGTKLKTLRHQGREGDQERCKGQVVEKRQTTL